MNGPQELGNFNDKATFLDNPQDNTYPGTNMIWSFRSEPILPLMPIPDKCGHPFEPIFSTMGHLCSWEMWWPMLSPGLVTASCESQGPSSACADGGGGENENGRQSSELRGPGSHDNLTRRHSCKTQ